MTFMSHLGYIKSISRLDHKNIVFINLDITYLQTVVLMLMSMLQCNQTKYHEKKCSKSCSCNFNTSFVDCSRRNLSQIPEDIPLWTKGLLLNYNDITYLPASMLFNRQQLENLNLSYNRISFAHDNAFEGMPKLKILDLRHNYLQNISDHVLQKTKRIRYLYLNDNLLTEIPSIYIKSKMIMSEMDLRANRIINATFPPAYLQVFSIANLYLGHNNIGRLTAGHIKHLNTSGILNFHCNYCNLSFIDSSNIFHHFDSLITLDLGNNPLSFSQLETLISSLNRNRKLQNLLLDSVINGYSLPSDFFKPLEQNNLIYLSLSNAKKYGYLANSTFVSLHSLTRLDLKRCEFTYIAEDAFRGLNILESLYLDYDGLPFRNYPLISKFFSNTLLRLGLSRNFVYHLRSGEFENLIDLTHLYLRACNIYSVNREAFPINNKLVFLDLSYNSIYRPDMFDHKTLGRLTHLEILKLEKNDFGGIFKNSPKFLSSFPNLTVLFLKRNGIVFLPSDFFIAQKKLTTLDLSANSLSDFDMRLFQPLEKPYLINLSYNKIQIIADKSITRWRLVNITDLEGNPFNCGCDMSWFIAQVQLWAFSNNSNVDSLKNYICGSPINLNGVKIIDIDIEKLEEACHPPSKILLYVSGASLGTVLVISVIVSLCHHFQWYIKWFWYRCHRRYKSSLVDDNEQTALLDTICDIYLSYHLNDEEWADEIVAKLECQDNMLLNELHQDIIVSDTKQNHNDTPSSEPRQNSALPVEQSHTLPAEVMNDIASFNEQNHIPTADSLNCCNVSFTTDDYKLNYDKDQYKFDAADAIVNTPCETKISTRQEDTMANSCHMNCLRFAPTVYYEKRFPPNKSCFEESARTIYTCKFVIVVLSAAYLNSRRLQFEFDLIQSAMRERYGYGALHHIVLITAEPSGELMHLMPHHLKNRLNKSCLFWSKTDNIQQRCFWEQLYRKLNKYYN